MNIRKRLERCRLAVNKTLRILIIIPVLFISSCEEDPSFLGRTILPSVDDIITGFSGDTEISTRTISSLPLVTTSNASIMLGSYNDEVFGSAKADFTTRIEVIRTEFETDFEIDSMVLSLAFDGHYGDSLFSQTLRVYELTDTLSSDTVYLSDFSPEGIYNPVELASGSFTPFDTILTFQISDPDLIQRFEEVNDTIFNNQDAFYDFFYGFYITTDTVLTRGGVLNFLDLSSSDTKLSMYYHLVDSVDTDEMVMRIGEYTPKVNSFYHDYMGSRVGSYIDTPDVEDTMIYISSMGGVSTKLTFPAVEEWLSRKPVAINKAELILPVSDTLFSGLTQKDFPARLSLYSFNDEDDYEFIYDYRVDNSSSRVFYDGIYDAIENRYRFNIGVHLQSYIQGDIDNLQFVLLPTQNALSANRVVLQGPGARTQKMELLITYTEF